MPPNFPQIFFPALAWRAREHCSARISLCMIGTNLGPSTVIDVYNGQRDWQTVPLMPTIPPVRLDSRWLSLENPALRTRRLR